MRIRHFIVVILAALAAAGAIPPAALALTVSGTFHVHDNVGANSVGSGTGNRLGLGAVTVDPSGPPTTVTATQGLTTLNLAFIPFSLIPQLYNTSLVFNPALTGSWTITAQRGGDVAVATTNAIPNPQLVPLAINPHVFGADLTPTIRWTLPDLSGFDVDRIRVRAWHDDVIVPGFASLNDLFFQSAALPADATEFEIPVGVLEKHRPYIFEILIEDTERTGQGILFTENRSRSFTPQPYEVSGPLSVVMLALGAGVLLLGARVVRRQPD